jgi:hypothetical protein
MRTLLLILLLAAVGILPGQTAPDPERPVAVTDCRIVTMNGPDIPKGTLIIRNGLIEAVGTRVPIPADAEIIRGENLIVYPGLIDALNQSLVKLPEKPMDRLKFYTNDFTDEDLGIVPERRAVEFFNIDKGTLEKYRKSGITAAEILPLKGIFTGRSAIFCLGETEGDKNRLVADRMLGISFEVSGLFAYPSSLMGSLAYLRQAFSDASHYDLVRTRWEKSPAGLRRPAYSARHETLAEYATGRKPVLFICRNQHDMLRAISLGQEFKLDYVLLDKGGEGFRVIEELKQARARLILPLGFKIPSTSLEAQWGAARKEKAEKDLYPQNAAKLAAAGIPFVFSSVDTDEPQAFLDAVQKAISAGLPREKALEILTRRAAEFIGQGKTMGTVEKGKIANLIVSQGEPLVKESTIRTVFTDGLRYDIKGKKATEKPTVNISGRWEIVLEQADMKLTAEFSQEEGSLSGKLSLPFGVFDFSGGSVSGNEIYWEMTITPGGQQIELYFSAKVDGDTMKGTAVQGSAGSMDFHGKRSPL